MKRFFAVWLLSGVCLTPMLAQDGPRFLGIVTSILGNTLTIKSDAGAMHVVDVNATASIRRVAPDETVASVGLAVPFSNLVVGDRVLVKLDPGAPHGIEQALQIIAAKPINMAPKQNNHAIEAQNSTQVVKALEVNKGSANDHILTLPSPKVQPNEYDGMKPSGPMLRAILLPAVKIKLRIAYEAVLDLNPFASGAEYVGAYLDAKRALREASAIAESKDERQVVLDIETFRLAREACRTASNLDDFKQCDKVSMLWADRIGAELDSVRKSPKLR